MIFFSRSLTFDFCRLHFTIRRLDKVTAVHCQRRTSTQTSNDGCPKLFPISDNVSVVIQGVLGYVHTVTFLHGFVLFHNPKGIPIYFQTIENDEKTLPCAHSLSAAF